MALQGPEGEQLNHISERRPEAGGLPGEPDRGQRVGVGVGTDYRRVGDASLDDRRNKHAWCPRCGLNATFLGDDLRGAFYQCADGHRWHTDALGNPLSDGQHETAKPTSDFGEVSSRVVAHKGIQYLLEHQPMIAEQRRILVMALGVLDSFA
jgi:hypothetical protein